MAVSISARVDEVCSNNYYYLHYYCSNDFWAYFCFQQSISASSDEGRRTKDLLIYDVHETETIWYFYAYSTRDILISPLCPSDSKARLLSTVGNWGLFYSAPQVFVVWGSF